uniref:Isochorismatase-like domain-containing protein n=3 Tax=Meloidogyne TaxID=189290 RepID=A0A915NNX2_9BILA
MVATNVSENQKEICGELEIHKQHHINPNNSVLLRIEDDQKVENFNECIERYCSAITFTGFLTSNLNSTNTQKCLLFFCTNNNSSSNIGGRCHFTKGTNEEINLGLLSVEMLRETFNNETNLLNESEKINGEDLQLSGEIEEITTQIKYKETTNHSFIDLSTWDEIFPLDPQHVPVWIIGLAIVSVVEFGPRPCDIYESRVRPFVKERTAVLVVDVQNWTMERGSLPLNDYFYEEANKRVVPNIKSILNCARECEIEVVFTVIENFTKDGRDRSLDYKISNFFVPKGSHDAKVIDELERREDEMVIPKTSSSLFNSTNFEYLMRNIGIDTIIVTGFLTDQCIAATICDGADRGFWMICVNDACGTSTRERHVNALNAFKGYCRMESTESIINAIQKDIKK